MAARNTSRAIRHSNDLNGERAQTMELVWLLPMLVTRISLPFISSMVVGRENIRLLCGCLRLLRSSGRPIQLRNHFLQPTRQLSGQPASRRAASNSAVQLFKCDVSSTRAFDSTYYLEICLLKTTAEAIGLRPFLGTAGICHLFGPICARFNRAKFDLREINCLNRFDRRVRVRSGARSGANSRGPPRASSRSIQDNTRRLQTINICA